MGRADLQQRDVMGKRKIVGLAAAAAAVLALACGQPLDVGNFSVAGTWTGAAVQHVGTDSASYTFVLKLQQDQRNVSGTATVQSGTQTVQATVAGKWNYPAVTLRLTAPGYADLDYAAQFAHRDTLRGPVTGSGFSSTTLTIVRQ